MGKLLLWPGIVVLFWLGSDVYGGIRPCEGGFAGLCWLTDAIFKAMAVESIIIYLFIALAMTKAKKARKRQVSPPEYIVAGLVSVGVVFGGLLMGGLGSAGKEYFFVSAPFIASSMFLVELLGKLRM